MVSVTLLSICVSIIISDVSLFAVDVCYVTWQLIYIKQTGNPKVQKRSPDTMSIYLFSYCLNWSKSPYNHHLNKRCRAHIPGEGY